MERESIQKNDLLLCRGSGIARQGKDIPEKDTCVFSLNGQTIESIVPKKLEFTQEPQTEGREKLKSVPARRETCLSERDFTVLTAPQPPCRRAWSPDISGSVVSRTTL